MRRRRQAGTETPIGAAWRVSRPGLIAVFLFTAFFNLLKFAMPLYLIQVLDRVPASRSIETLVLLTVMVVIAVLCGIALDVIRRRMLARWGLWIEGQLGPRLVHKGLQQSQAAEINTALAHVATLRTFVSGPMVPCLDVVFAPMFFVGIFIIHPVLGAIGLASLGALLLIAILSDVMTRDARRASRDAGKESRALVQAAEFNRETVGAFSMGTALTERWRRSAAARLDENQIVVDRQILFRSLRKGMNQFVRIAMIAAGIWLVVIGSLSFGGIFAARIMAGFGYSLADQALSNYRNMREAWAAYTALRSSLIGGRENATSILPGTESAPLVLDQLSFRHPGERTNIFNRLSLKLEQGQMLVVTGQAGSGKTTLTRLLVGVLSPRSGHIRLGDVEISRLPSDVRSKTIGVLPQHVELFEGTIRENIARMEDGDLADVVAAAGLVGIHDNIVRMPKGYDTVISGDTFGMSGSERKRIALARAFYKRPRIIVLDEPTANLDATARRGLESALADMKSGGATIVVTLSIHSTQISRMADRFLILGGGRHEVTVNDGPETLQRARNHLRSVK